MGNPVKGEVTREVDGKTFTFRLGMNEACIIEEQFDKSVDRILSDFETVGLSLRRLRFIVKATVQGEELTDVEAGQLLDAVGISTVVEIIDHSTIFADLKKVQEQAKKKSRPVN